LSRLPARLALFGLIALFAVAFLTRYRPRRTVAGRISADSDHLAQRPETSAKFFRKKLRLFPGREVAALGSLL
jgi:hypothetical protein